VNKQRCQSIAGQIHALLVAEIGQGIESHRMLAEPLYARDVLLVCEALSGTSGAQFAALYRAAAVEPPSQAPEPVRAGNGITALLSSIFGPISALDPPVHAPPKSRSWFGRSATK
jgi:hypothetical protein